MSFISKIVAICEPRHWNWNRTDFINAIIFSSIRPMDPKLSRVIT